jgi:phosphatidylserine/phosphatidylglycerophosphate/cardiolipin synthase-like enzyme
MFRTGAVWTGSFNLTFNAQQSLENAVLLREPALVEAYFHEFGQIMAISEQLDWESDWVEPEHRIGT